VKIVHWAPFAPSRCGLYEAARDCVRADLMRGHEVLFCDTGPSPKAGEREPPLVGAMDPRGGWVLETSAWADATDADLWVCHDGVPDQEAARCQVPMIWLIHGRPYAAFRLEQDSLGLAAPYTVIRNLGQWPRVKALVTMWDEHLPHWELVVPEGKLHSTVDPPVDGGRFLRQGKVRELTRAGKYNLLVCDSWREDVDVYETAVACYHAAKRRPGTRVHLWAVEPGKDEGCWQHLYRALDEIGALGEVHAREGSFDEVYRAMSAVVSPHSIGVRTITEALCCGTPVVAASGCRYTPYTGDPRNVLDMADAIVRCLDDVADGRDETDASPFGLELFGDRMETIYQGAVGASLEVSYG